MFAPATAGCKEGCARGESRGAPDLDCRVDTHNRFTTLLATMLALLGLGLATSLDNTVDRLFRAIAVMTFVGTGVAYRRHQRRPDLDPFPVITRWSYLGLAVGLSLRPEGS